MVWMMKDIMDFIRKNLKHAKNDVDDIKWTERWQAAICIRGAFDAAYEEYNILYHSLSKMGYEYDYPELMFGKLWEEAGL